MDSRMPLGHLRHSIFVVLVLMILACSSDDDARTYRNGGFSVKIPREWSPIMDSEGTILADRQIAFQTGEFSFVGFYIFTRPRSPSAKRLDLDTFVTQYLQAVVGDTTAEDIEVHKSTITREAFNGVGVDIKEHFMGEQQSLIEAYLSKHGSVQIFVVANSERAVAETVARQMPALLGSIEYNQSH